MISPPHRKSTLFPYTTLFRSAFGLASRVRDSLVGPMHQPVLIWVAAGAWLLARACAGLYPGYGMAAPEELRTSVITTLAVVLGEVAAFFVLKESAASRLVVRSEERRVGKEGDAACGES